MGMVKVIDQSSFDQSVGTGMELVSRQGEMTKQASTIFGMDYSDMKPDDRHVGIHVVALGDEEHYGANRNADSFDKQACIKYHDTFVKHGHVFRHHMNKQAEKAIGKVVASAYNEPMGRIELFIHADKEKAAPELERLEKDGEIPFSMAAFLPFDVCSVCGAMRKSAGDSSECEHVRDHLGELWDDGRKVFTRNTEPKFFDISFVGKPADRIAWNLTKAASSGHVVDSARLAVFDGVTAPDDIAIDPGAASRKLAYARAVSGIGDKYVGWLSKVASASSVEDRYLYAFAGVQAPRIDDATIDRMREVPVRDMLSKLASCGIVMDVPTFFKYAMGDGFDIYVKPVLPGVEAAVPALLSRLVKTSSVSSLCNDTTYDAYSDPHSARVPARVSELLSKVASPMLDPARAAMECALSGDVPEYLLDGTGEKCLDGGVVEKLAEAYVSYQLSAIDAVVNGRRSRQGGGGPLEVEAIAAAGNLHRR